MARERSVRRTAGCSDDRGVSQARKSRNGGFESNFKSLRVVRAPCTLRGLICVVLRTRVIVEMSSCGVCRPISDASIRSSTISLVPLLIGPRSVRLVVIEAQ